MGGWGELYPVLFWIFWIFLTLLSPLVPDGGFAFFNLLTAILISSNIILYRCMYDNKLLSSVFSSTEIITGIEPRWQRQRSEDCRIK